MYAMFLNTWGGMFKKLIENPVSLMIWVVVLVVLLFVLSRVNNYMEVKGVNRAIGITRALVGSFMYFIIAPIVLFIFINIMALIYGVPMIDISFLGKWIALTGTSYFWLLKCLFNSAGLTGQEEAYTMHSIIRILWILIPISLIWLRTAKKRVGKLLLIPLIIGVIVVTRHKKAPETFITKDINIETLQNVPVIGIFFEENKGKSLGFENGLGPMQRKVIAGVLVVLLAAGLGVGLFGQQRVIGLVLAMIGVFGFMFLAPSQLKDDILVVPEHKDHPFHHDIDSLVHRLDSVYQADGEESMSVYELTLKIDQAYRAQQHKEEFPDSLCARYRKHFYDWCH